MDSASVIGTMIAACTVFVVLVVMAKPLRFLMGFVVNSCLGVVAIAAANFLLSSFNFSLGINFLTAGFIGILGLPGFVGLLIIQLLL